MTEGNDLARRETKYHALVGLGAGASGHQTSQQTMVLEFGDCADVAPQPVILP